MVSRVAAAPGDGWDPIGGIGDVINGISGAVSYWSDPWGNTFEALQNAAAGLSRDVLPALTEATLPDLSAEWFNNAYRVSFATALLVAVLLLIPQAVRTARGFQAGRDLVESIGLYFGLFLVGAMFGPAMGIVLVNFFHALSNAFVSWGVEGTIDGVIGEFQAMITDADPVGITGGIPIAVLLMLCMLIGLFLVLLILIVQLVTLYFTGVLLPLGLVWIIDPTKRSFGMKLASLWVGILAAHPLLFFLLGFAFTMMSNSVGTFGNNLNLQALVTLLVAVIALFVAALSPLLLLKFAPVIPMAFGGTNGPSLTPSTIGSRNMTDAGNRFGFGNRNDDNTTSAERETIGPSETVDATTTRTSLSEIASSRTNSGHPADAPAVTSVQASSLDTSGIPSRPAVAASTPASTADVAVAGRSATAVAPITAAAPSAAEAGIAAGAAESSTGAGAVVGIPTLIAATGIAAASKALKVTESAAEQAADAMDEPHIGKDYPQ
jgi:type IV secretion system protein TrbL